MVWCTVCEIEESISKKVETKYLESVETQVSVKIEDTTDENVTRSTDQEVIEVEGSHKHSNTLSNLETHKQLVPNSSKDLNGIGTRSRKSKHAIKTDFAWCYKTDGTTSWEKKDKEKINVIKAPVISVEAHEYTSLTIDKHVCNHCQQTYKKLKYLKRHIKRMHREVTTMYHCPYCPYKSKWKHYIIKEHIIQKHKDTKDIQWFQCNLCEMKFKLKSDLTRHMKVHLRHKQMEDGLDLNKKRYHCDKCDYKTYTSTNLKRHKLSHLKPEDIPYFHCYHCSHKNKHKHHLKYHILKHFRNEDVPFHCYICDFITQKRQSIIEHIKKHSNVQIKFEINEGSQ